MPFAPDVAIELADPLPRTPSAITATVTHRSGEPNIATISAAFPRAFDYNEQFVQPRCLAADEAAETCPPSSRIGSVSAQSPLGGAGGDLFITDDFRLVAFASALGGLIRIRVDGTITLTPEGGFAVAFSGLPDLPLSSITLALDGGERALIKTPARCATYTLPVVFTAHNDEQAQAAPSVPITGCAPPGLTGVSVSQRNKIARVSFTTDATATRVRLLRKGRTLRDRQVRTSPTTFTGLAPGRYSVKLKALPNGASARKTFTVTR